MTACEVETGGEEAEVIGVAPEFDIARDIYNGQTYLIDLKAACDKAGVKLYLPPLKWCGDNGAMIGAQGYYEYLAGHTAGTTLNAYATMDLGDPVY